MCLQPRHETHHSRCGAWTLTLSRSSSSTSALRFRTSPVQGTTNCLMQHEYHHVPVTALARSSRATLLAGEGNYICVYDSSRSALITQAKVFEQQALHGIVLGDDDDDRGLVYGGWLIRLLWVGKDADSNIIITLGGLLSANDWILDAALSPLSKSAAVITAHNALWVIRQTDEDECSAPVDRIERVVPGSNCILYSAHVKWLSASHCLIASGTAFGDVILWSTYLMENRKAGLVSTQTHFTFSAHNGSVFGVQISHLSTLPGSVTDKKRMLATCSDDRHIKLWDVSDLTQQSPTLMEVQRDTGFGSQPDEAGVAPRCLTQVMGHVSRIWCVHFAPSGPDEILDKVYSFGEDASVIKWQIKPNSAGSQLPYVLEKSLITNAHHGKNIWATVLDQSGALVTGGADGTIVVSSCIQPEHEREIPQLLLQRDDLENDRIKAYSFVAPDAILASTEQGALVLIDLSASQTESLSHISEPIPALKGYSIIASTENLAFVAGTDGSVYIYNHEKRSLATIAEIPRKAIALLLCRLDPDKLALLVVSVGGNIGRLFFIDRECKVTSELSIELPTSFVVTSFACRELETSTYVFLGSRSGSLAVYNVDSSATTALVTALDRRNLVHGKEAITALQCVSSDKNKLKTWIFSTGRDGTLAIHFFDTSGGEYDLLLTQQLTLPFGPNIEGLHLSPAGSIWAWGFKSTQFIVYDVVDQRQVMSVECGGAHRTWAFHPKAEGGIYVWTKASKVLHTRQNELPYTMLNGGGHGREIKSVAVFSPAEGRQIIATGAEDTDIKLFRLVDGRFKCLQTLRKHNTGIQHLQFSTDGRHLFSSGGFEEFFVWKITPDLPYVDMGVVCEAKHPRSGTSDLRITGFEAQRWSEEELVISMAYSDSTVKIWRYGSSAWECIASAEYATSCLTQVLSSPGHTNCFWTTATDGHMAEWALCNQPGGEQRLQRIHGHRIHQSAIHATTSHVLSDQSILVATGGDDNAVSITRITRADSSEREMDYKTLRIPRAHAGAVTGLAVLPRGDPRHVWLASAALDQRVKLWEIRVDAKKEGIDGVSVKLLQNVFSAVADISGLEICRLEDGGTGLLLCGVGMDVWRLPDEEHTCSVDET